MFPGSRSHSIPRSSSSEMVARDTAQPEGGTMILSLMSEVVVCPIRFFLIALLDLALA